MGSHNAVGRKKAPEPTIFEEMCKACNHITRIAIELVLVFGICLLGHIGESAVMYAVTLSTPWEGK